MLVSLIGYGEVGRILAEDLRAQGVLVSACDRMGITIRYETGLRLSLIHISEPTRPY